MKLLHLIFLCLLINVPLAAQDTPIQHVVTEGETLYSIARKYKVPVQKIFELNHISDKDYKVKLGETLIISGSSAAAVPPAANSKNEKIHIVNQGETLYRIAKQYQVTPESIIALNKIQNGNIQLGQKLKIPDSENSTPAISSKTEKSIALPAASNAPQDVVSNEKKYTKAYQKNEAAYFDKGMAEKIEIEKTESDSKFYAIHASAPIGTILKVRSLVNDKVAFVKVIANFEQQEKADVLLKISAAAHDYLEAGSNKFLVEISYVNQKK